jgi:hypothetical protein
MAKEATTTTTIATLITIVVVIIVAAITTTTGVYAQQPDEIYLFDDASLEAKQFAIGIAAQQLWNLTGKDPSIRLSEDGSLSITEVVDKPDGSFDIITISVQHNMTSENGYDINGGILYAPNGTGVFP